MKKAKKPFYKRWWFWLLVIVLIAIIGSGLGNSNKKNNNQPSTKTTAKSSSHTNSGKITRKQFDAIKLGDLMKNASAGDSLSTLKNELGKPSSTSTDTTNGVKTDVLVWDKVEGGLGANISVGFTNDHAFSKDITGFKFDRKQKITLADFNQFNTGAKYTDVVNKFGEPDGYNETLIAGKTTVIATYMSGIKGSIGANFNMTFTNGVLSGKAQTDMK